MHKSQLLRTRHSYVLGTYFLIVVILCDIYILCHLSIVVILPYFQLSASSSNNVCMVNHSSRADVAFRFQIYMEKFVV